MREALGRAARQPVSRSSAPHRGLCLCVGSYCAVLLTIMPIVLGEQLFGPHATSRPGLVLAVYAAYVIMPALVAWRVRHPEVFRPRVIEEAAAAEAEAEAHGPAGTRARHARSPQRKKRV